MGFLDKVKDAGKGALKGALTMAAHSYGTVWDGKHKLCKVCLNNDYTEIVFIKVAAEEARYNIKETFKTFEFSANSDTSCRLELVYNNGEKSVVQTMLDKNKGSALPTDQHLAAIYGDVAALVGFLMLELPDVSETTKIEVNKVRLYAKMSTF